MEYKKINLRKGLMARVQRRVDKEYTKKAITNKKNILNNGESILGYIGISKSSVKIKKRPLTRFLIGKR